MSDRKLVLLLGRTLVLSALCACTEEFIEPCECTSKKRGGGAESSGTQELVETLDNNRADATVARDGGSRDARADARDARADRAIGASDASADRDAEVTFDAQDGSDTGATACATLLTLQPGSFAAGTNADRIAVGRFDGDTALDVAITNRSFTSKVGVLLGTGSGTFGSFAPFTTTVNPLDVAVADLNGDLKDDILVVGADGPNPGAVSVLLGNGDGTFQTHVPYPVGVGASAVTLGDVNGDGALDVLATNFADATVSILLGHISGNGTLLTPTTVATAQGPWGLALGTMNGDAHLDLVVSNSQANTVSVFLGNGDGTFQARQDYATSLGPTAIALADLNGDLQLDVVSVNTPDSVSVLLGDGTGALQPRVDYATGAAPVGIRLGDVSQDGTVDIVVACASGSIDVLRGNGNGSFAAREIYALPGQFPIALALGDLSGDGRADVVVVNDNNEAKVFLNTCTP